MNVSYVGIAAGRLRNRASTVTLTISRRERR